MKNLWAVLLAQFLSAFADNMVFIVAITQLKLLYGSNTPLLPYLQESFVVAFIFLAPFVGPIADSFSKRKVMAVANTIKLLGAILMLSNTNILFSYLVIGIGAAMYSPAKYGILIQLLPKEQLVKANGALEGSTIVAILLGVVLGGLIVDASSVQTGFYIVGALYLAATAITFFIKRVPSEQELRDPGFITVIKNFLHAVKLLLSNDDSKVSMLGTSVFWGVGSMLRVFLFAWVPYMFLINDTSTPSNLMGALSIGIVIGAIFAAKYFTINNAHRALVFGVWLGVLIAILSVVSNIYLAGALMVLLGISGGLLVIPLNSLLQYRGHQLTGAGNSLAVQNFFENIFMLIAVGLFNLAIIYEVKLNYFLLTSGVVLALFFIVLQRVESKKLQ